MQKSYLSRISLAMEFKEKVDTKLRNFFKDRTTNGDRRDWGKPCIIGYSKGLPKIAGVLCHPSSSRRLHAWQVDKTWKFQLSRVSRAYCTNCALRPKVSTARWQAGESRSHHFDRWVSLTFPTQAPSIDPVRPIRSLLPGASSIRPRPFTPLWWGIERRGDRQESLSRLGMLRFSATSPHWKCGSKHSLGRVES